MNLTEKYRPEKLEDVVGQEHIVLSLKNKGKDDLTHMIFSGPPGSGKTTIAYILAKTLDLPIHEINSSDENGIDVVRGEIKRLSRITGRRFILLDEADSLTPQAQAALRRTMERTNNAIFVLTGNNSWKIISALKSRCVNFDFKKLDDIQVLKRLLFICEKENIIIDEEAQRGLIELVKQSDGDMRKAINVLSKVMDNDKKITVRAVLSFQKPKKMSEALQIAVNGDFPRAQKLVEDAFVSSHSDIGELIREFYEAIPQVQDERVKIQLYVKLAEAEKACKNEADPILPLVQLIGFLAYAWLLPHLNNSCPVLQG